MRARLEELEDRLARASAELRSATDESGDAADALDAAENLASRARARYEALRERTR